MRRKWSSSSRSKQTLLALTPEVNARRNSELVSQRGTRRALRSVFRRLRSANRRFSPIEPDVSEIKYYAKGSGQAVLAVDVSGGSDMKQLVKYTH